MRYTLRIFICCTLLGVFTSGIFFVSENPYSINKKQTTFGETRSISELIFSNLLKTPSGEGKLEPKLRKIIFN